MRILNIFFKNINSLEGEGRVSFDQGPIADSGVFAITGPNGSGKTSILDVITLGLYGETFRFDKPAAHVMTKRTNECFAEVEFALGGERFRSRWSMANEGADSAPQMRLQRMDEQAEVLAETPNQVRQRIADLTGMDFHKFSKSMVLPQGDFAAFLNALDSERMDILEKISGSDFYAEYRRQVEDTHAEAQQRLQQLQQDIGSIPLLNQETLEAAALDLQDFQDQVAVLKQQQAQLKQQLSAVESVATLQKQQSQLEKRRYELLARITQRQADLQHIAANQSALAFQEELARVDHKQSEFTQQQAALENYRRELSLLQQQLGDGLLDPALTNDNSFEEQQRAIDALKLTVSELKLELPRQNELAQAIQQQITGNQASLAEVNGWLEAHGSDAALLEDFPEIARLRNVRNEVVELAGRQKRQSNWTKNTNGALKKHQAALVSTRTEMSDLETQIAEDEKKLIQIAQGHSFESLKELLLEQQDRVNDFKEMNALAEVLGRLTKKGWFSWLTRSKEDEPADENELQTTLDALRLELSREENIIQVLELAIRNEAMIRKMSADRARLVEGQPCYLCGSIVHPYVLKPPVASNSKKALIDQRGKIQALKSRISNVQIQLKAAIKTSSRQDARQQRIQQMRSQWTVLANRLGVMRNGMEISNLSLQKQILAEETEELNRISNLVKEHAQLQRDIANAKAGIERKQLQLQNLEQKVAELEDAWNNRPAEFDGAEQRYLAAQADEKALVAKLEQQLAALGEKMPGKGKENPLFDRLNARRQDYQVYLLRQKGLVDENQALQDKYQACQASIIAYQERLATSLEALGEQERVGLHFAILEKQKLIVGAEQQLRDLQIESEVVQRNLAEKLVTAGLNGIDDLRKLLDLLSQTVTIEQACAADQEQLARLEQQLGEMAATLVAQLEVIATSPDEEDMQREYRQVTEQLAIAEQELRSVQTKLDKQEQYRERYYALREQLDQQEAVFQRAEAERLLIQDERGAFRKRVQQLMIDKLLSHANRILETLSGRYYVRGMASEHGLALEIEDTKQNNQQRLPQTLSGGESFVVSLALALALSEVANNGRAIDSLFLDEGFGNLDAESLYLAMSTLESLKTHGKTVGVISHVDGVKKRIKTQIELVKKANGLSELKMVA